MPASHYRPAEAVPHQCPLFFWFIAVTMHQQNSCDASSRAFMRCCLMSLLIFSISNSCIQKFLPGVFCACCNPSSFCTTDTVHCIGTPNALSCTLLFSSGRVSGHSIYSPRPSSHRQRGHDQDNGRQRRYRLVRKNFANQIHHISPLL